MGTLATNIATLSLVGITTHATATTIGGGAADSGSAIAGAPVLAYSVSNADRITSNKSIITVEGFPVGSEVVLMTVHGQAAGVNSSVIG